jgi:hypothetical protein
MVMMRNESTPLWRALVFWGGLLFLIQQAERLFLLRDVAATESPTASLLAKTFLMGLGNDLIVACVGIAAALVLAVILTSLLLVRPQARTRQGLSEAYRRNLTFVFVLMAVFLVCFSTADVCYYAYNHQHLDFVFFEFVDELFHGVSEGTTSQAAEQTGAELEDTSKWIWRIGGFWGLGALLIVAWRALGRRMEYVGGGPWKPASFAAGLLLVCGTMSGAAAGWGHVAKPFAEALQIQSEAYYSLSKNPILFAASPLRDAFLSQWTWSPSSLPQPMTVMEAIQDTHAALGKGEIFPYSDYPLVKVHRDAEPPYFGRPVNVLLVFVEGLDRRFLDHLQPIGDPISTEGSSTSGSLAIRITPFLDHLKNDSLYFSHFFSNGVQTTRGLFSTLCSAFPRQGTAAIKTRYRHDYLCLPSVLRNAGYSTEMVVSLDADLPHLHEFLSKNGIDRYYGEQDFPTDAERLGVGLTDGALFDFVETRLDALQASGRPFFLTMLTAGTHHPFAVPNDHPEVKALQRESDHYMASLRYFDLAFERFVSRLQSKGLLKNTIMIILGDHGRHESIGTTDAEHQAGHFLSPLYFWVDETLRREGNYRPRVVDYVASQVDVAPTVLAINGLTPPVAPFMGRNVTCLLTADCLSGGQAYLSSVYDDLIGLADPSGIWMYSFRRDLLTAVDLDLQYPATHPSLDDPAAREKVRLMTALYLASNTLLEQNRLWSWQIPGSKQTHKPPSQR